MFVAVSSCDRWTAFEWCKVSVLDGNMKLWMMLCDLTSPSTTCAVKVTLSKVTWGIFTGHFCDRIEQSVSRVCLSLCSDDNFRTEWPLKYRVGQKNSTLAVSQQNNATVRANKACFVTRIAQAHNILDYYCIVTVGCADYAMAHNCFYGERRAINNCYRRFTASASSYEHHARKNHHSAVRTYCRCVLASSQTFCSTYLLLLASEVTSLWGDRNVLLSLV